MFKLRLILFLTFSISVQVFCNFRVVSIEGGNILSQNKTTASIIQEYVYIQMYRDTCRVTF